jgi:hypothetical protein
MKSELPAASKKGWDGVALEFAERPVMVNLRMVNGGESYYLPAARLALFRDFARDSCIQKVR